jgi:hypothetical protein
VRTVAIGALFATMFAGASVTASAQSAPPSTNSPSLSETLQWLTGASEVESVGGDEHHTFESDGKDVCSATITEFRDKATPGFWIKLSFSLADIDPDDIRVDGKSAVYFHTTNYTKKIIHTSSQFAEPIPTLDYFYFTNDWFAPKFAKAFAHAARLCGAKRSSF